MKAELAEIAEVPAAVSDCERYDDCYRCELCGRIWVKSCVKLSAFGVVCCECVDDGR